MKKYLYMFMILAVAGCEEIDHEGEWTREQPGQGVVRMEDVARLLTAIDIGHEQITEVHDAVSSSSSNGYDEEYMMKDLFSSPGAGVGDREGMNRTKNTEKTYSRPLRDLISEYLGRTKASTSAEEYIESLSASGLQIYWPFSEEYDGFSEPVITFDPGDGSEANTGFRIDRDSKGVKSVEEIIIDEDYARAHPVWVINRNDDSGYQSLEMLRRNDPDWGTGGGTITVKASEKKLRTLILKDFIMHRNYDTWFAGGSEFFVKIGALDDFTASTEAELLIYQPLITDFMITVKRSQRGKPVPFNAVLISNWTPQLENCAFMITEDDGGTRTSWKTEAEVKIKSKTYGVNVNLPYNSRDDIVWRGHLAAPFLEKYSNVPSRFGDIEITFEILEK